MIKPAFFFLGTLAFLGANLHFYNSNLRLEKVISLEQQQCQSRLSQLQERYKDKPLKTLKKKVVRTVNQDAEEQTVAPLPKVNLEELVSYRHRVQAVTRKYDFLLETAQIEKTDKKLLRRLLTRRERLANTIAFAETDPNADLYELDEQLIEVEEQLYSLLNDPVDYLRYEYLRERSL